MKIHLPTRWLGRTSREEELESLLQRYGLKGHVAMREDHFGSSCFVTLVREIKDEGERHIPLPPDFVRKVEEIVRRWHDSLKYSYLHFQTGAGMTQEEIRKYQEAWSFHCKLAATE